MLEVVLFCIPEGNLMCYRPEASTLISTDVDRRSKMPAFNATAVEVICA